MSWRWPVTLRTALPSGEPLALRPLLRRDRGQWRRLRAANEGWLAPWESTVPTVPTEQPAGTVDGGELHTERLPFGQLRRGFNEAARAGSALPFVIEADGELVGQMQLFDVLWGARQSGSAGYWLAESATGRGIATWSLALLIDHALLRVGLHRVEVLIREENDRSLAVVERLGLPEEGMRRSVMHVRGGWRDHRCFAIVETDLRTAGYAAGGLLGYLREHSR